MVTLKPFAAASLAAGITLLSAAATHAAVQRLVTTGDVIDGRTLTGISARPDINDSGQVVYLADFADGQALFIDQSEIVGPGTVIDGVALTTFYGPTPVINNAGTVAYDQRPWPDRIPLQLFRLLLSNIRRHHARRVSF